MLIKSCNERKIEMRKKACDISNLTGLDKEYREYLGKFKDIKVKDAEEPMPLYVSKEEIENSTKKDLLMLRRHCIWLSYLQFSCF